MEQKTFGVISLVNSLVRLLYFPRLMKSLVCHRSHHLSIFKTMQNYREKLRIENPVSEWALGLKFLTFVLDVTQKGVKNGICGEGSKSEIGSFTNYKVLERD